MPRTPIPDYLIHRPEEVERNAKRFDKLCRLAEEVAFPVVREALVRETAATGAEALTNEARLTLEALAGNAAALEGLDEPEVLDEVRRSLSAAIPPPDEDECRALARDMAQVLTSTWLEMLRSDLSKSKTHPLVLVLSDHLLPDTSSGTMRQFIDALAPFAVNELDVGTIMTTLRVRLFPELRLLLDLPFELVMAGAPGKPVLATTRPTYERALEGIPRVPDPTPFEPRPHEFAPATSAQYMSLTQVASSHLKFYLH